MAESITITDNRTGESLEIPIDNGGVDAAEWRKLLPGIWFHDPGLATTSGADSAITELDGENGILRYRGYPIEQLAQQSTFLEVSYLLIHGELPTQPQLDRGSTRSPTTPSSTRSSAPGCTARPLRRASDGSAHLQRRRPVDLLPRRQGHRGSRRSHGADRPADRQDADDGGLGVPPRHGPALRLPRQRARLPLELPEHDVPGRQPLRGPPGVAQGDGNPLDSPRRSRAELLHHGRTSGRIRPRRPVQLGCRCRCRPLRPSPWRRQRGGAQHARRHRQPRQRSRLHRKRQGRRGTPDGLRSPGVQELRPPRAIIKDAAYDVFEVTGKNPRLDIALKLEEVALSDSYFVDRKLYPNVDFYSGLIYESMGFPVEMFTVLFAIGRTPGWLAHWNEMLEQNSRIARPRQRYIGADVRDYVAIDDR